MRRAHRSTSTRLEDLRRQFEKWRAKVGGKGGRGRPIPDNLWSEAVAVARTEGVSATARALRLSWYALSDRMKKSSVATNEFVELDSERIFFAGRTVFQFIGRDGERLRIDAADARAAEVVEIAIAFWSRGA